MSLTSCPLVEGLAFDTGPEGVYAVQDYAMASGKSVRVERASGSDRRLVCSSEQPCAFYVQIYRQRMSDKKTYGKWYIASQQLTHSETCDSKRRLTTRQIAELPSFLAAVQANPKASIESLVALVREQHGVALDKQVRLVYRARELVRNGKAVVRSNILPSEDAPIPPRQFVRRHAKEKKMSPEPKKAKNPDRMAWTDVLIESLLIERLVKHGQQFLEAGEQSQHRELWEIIHKEFNEMHEENVTVTQLRAKFRYLQEQHMRVRGEEEEATRDVSKTVIYPRCWDMLAEYFGDDVPRSSPSVGVDHEEVVTKEGNDDNHQAVDAPSQVENRLAAQLTPVQTASVQSAMPTQSVSTQNMQLMPMQPVYAYSIPAQADPQALVPLVRQVPSPERDVAPKRRKLEPQDVSAAQQEATQATLSDAAPSREAPDVVETLETIQSTQFEMARSMDGMKQVVEQSNEAIRGLQQALTQSNQVNAALLDFLRRQPST
jgi:hypothetical protein